MRIKRYETHLLYRALNDIPGYMGCQNSENSCSSGQIHIPGGLFHSLHWELFVPNRADSYLSDSQPKMICTKCKLASCFTCKTRWHKNQTCAQYQSLLNDGESEEYIGKYCKKCPRSACGAPTKKYKACHEMSCANGEFRNSLNQAHTR
jgi:hypothetical protein